MHELFNHFIFDSSFSLHYEANEEGMFKFPVTAHLYMNISKEMKISGIIGSCKSLLEDKFNQSGETPVGEGKTSSWYLGGIQPNSALTVFLTNSDGNNDANQKVQQALLRIASSSSSLLSNTLITECDGESTQ